MNNRTPLNLNEFVNVLPQITMNTRNISLLAVALCVLTMIPSCQHVVYTADMANLNRQYARGEITKKEYAEKKAHFDFERSLAGPVIRMGTFSEERNRNRNGGAPQLKPARTGGSIPYAYRPSPQYEYVYGPAHRPGGGYIPQPQQVYVNGPAHNPGGGYTPQPQQAYVYNTPHNPGGGYTPQPLQAYVQNNQGTPGGGYKRQPQQAYVQNTNSKPSGGNDTPVQPPKYVYNKQPPSPSQMPVPSNPDSDDPGDYIYGYDGSKHRRSEALTKQMTAQGDNLARGAQAGLDTIEGAVAATTAPSLGDRIKGFFGFVTNAPAAAKGVKDNAQAIVKPSPQNTGLGWQPMKTNSLPEWAKR